VLVKVNVILDVVKRNPLFFHSISCKNNGFLFTPNIINASNMNVIWMQYECNMNV